MTQQNPFDVYLQRQKEGKTWRLALPRTGNNTKSTWVTYLLIYLPEICVTDRLLTASVSRGSFCTNGLRTNTLESGLIG